MHKEENIHTCSEITSFPTIRFWRSGFPPFFFVREFSPSLCLRNRPQRYTEYHICWTFGGRGVTPWIWYLSRLLCTPKWIICFCPRLVQQSTYVRVALFAFRWCLYQRQHPTVSCEVSTLQDSIPTVGEPVDSVALKWRVRRAQHTAHPPGNRYIVVCNIYFLLARCWCDVFVAVALFLALCY